MASGASCTPLQWFFWFFTLKHFFWPIDEVVLHECDLLQRKFKSQDTGDHCLEFRSVGQLFWKYITTLFLEGAATTSLNWNYCYPHMIFPLLFWASKIFFTYVFSRSSNSIDIFAIHPMRNLLLLDPWHKKLSRSLWLPRYWIFSHSWPMGSAIFGYLLQGALEAGGHTDRRWFCWLFGRDPGRSRLHQGNDDTFPFLNWKYQPFFPSHIVVF